MLPHGALQHGTLMRGKSGRAGRPAQWAAHWAASRRYWAGAAGGPRRLGDTRSGHAVYFIAHPKVKVKRFPHVASVGGFRGPLDTSIFITKESRLKAQALLVFRVRDARYKG